MIELAVFDIAGTTVDEGGTVYRVLADTVRAAGADPTPDQIEAWMGASKREAIQALLPGAADSTVDAAFADFRSRLADAYKMNPPQPFTGVPEAIQRLRRSGIKVALTTGFDRDTTASLLASIGWGDDVVDGVICIDDVTAGRPGTLHGLPRDGGDGRPPTYAGCSWPATRSGTSRPAERRRGHRGRRDHR